MDSQQPQQLLTSTANEVIPIICGTFTSIYLYILHFSTSSRHLTIQHRLPAHGPHQYLALTPGRAGLYATSWKWPPSLYSWGVQQGAVPVGQEEGGAIVELTYEGKTPITAISSYITITNTHIYSIGGPTGEVHAKPCSSSSASSSSSAAAAAAAVDAGTTGFGEKVQEVLFVPEDELEGWDKTNKALRYGAHGIEFDPNGRAYIPDLGTNSIWVHQTLPDGTLQLVNQVKSIREGDGPRHAVVSSNGRCLYSVTEHTQFVDVYDITEEGLEYVHSSSLIPKDDDPHAYRGDTIRISKSTPYVFATTRGATPATRGWLCAYAVDPATGHLANPRQGQGAENEPSAVFRTPTSGGKANAIEVIAVNGRGRRFEAEGEGQGREEMDWIVLTDSEQGLVLVISWNGHEFREVSRVKMMEGDGASHAVWLE